MIVLARGTPAGDAEHEEAERPGREQDAEAEFGRDRVSHPLKQHGDGRLGAEGDREEQLEADVAEPERRCGEQDGERDQAGRSGEATAQCQPDAGRIVGRLEAQHAGELAPRRPGLETYHKAPSMRGRQPIRGTLLGP